MRTSPVPTPILVVASAYAQDGERLAPGEVSDVHGLVGERLGKLDALDQLARATARSR
jgi:hypothetical protein